MYKRLGIIAVVIAGCMFAGGPMAQAQTTTGSDDALLTQVKQLASQGQDANTAAQISQYVDGHQDMISSILSGYLNYIKQLQTMSADDGTGAPVGRQRMSTSTAGQSGGAQASAGVQASTGVQASGGLQTSSVQPSGGLQTGHLAGYPSLPDVDPTTSVTTMSAAQVDYAAKVRAEDQARKEYLMAHPHGYSY